MITELKRKKNLFWDEMRKKRDEWDASYPKNRVRVRP